jgi:uncharacterized membrane protein HdeD (DUF308 family)
MRESPRRALIDWSRLGRAVNFYKAIGVILIVLGVLALITPLTPGSWLALIGMEFLEIRSAFLEKLKERFSKK